MAVVGGALLSLPELANSNDKIGPVPKGWFFLVGLMVLLVGAIAADRRTSDRLASERTNQRLASENAIQAEAVRSLCRLELELMAQDLGYWSTARISLFAKRNAGFELIGRFSANPTLCSHSREIYPEEGCLGAAWRDGEAALSGLPDPSEDPEAWLEAQVQRCELRRQVAARLRMRSRTYVALRIPGAPPADPGGVIVFESVLAIGDQQPDVVVPEPSSLKQRFEVPSHLVKLQGLLNVTKALEAPNLPR